MTDNHSDPIPQVVEVEVYSRCNRRCSYCPVSVNSSPDVPVQMSDEIFQKTLRDLAEWGFSGRLSYHFYSEPLLRLDFVQLVTSASQQLPAAKHVLYTNGDKLDEKRYCELMDAGIDQFIVTRHDSDTFPERERQIVLTPSELVLTNRGGSVRPGKLLYTPCFVPSELMVVTANGDVLLCYEDALRNDIFGNVMQQSLDTIWFSEQARRARKVLAAGDRKNGLAACTLCDNTTHSRPNTTWFAL